MSSSGSLSLFLSPHSVGEELGSTCLIYVIWHNSLGDNCSHVFMYECTNINVDRYLFSPALYLLYVVLFRGWPQPLRQPTVLFIHLYGRAMELMTGLTEP